MFYPFQVVLLLTPSLPASLLLDKVNSPRKIESSHHIALHHKVASEFFVQCRRQTSPSLLHCLTCRSGTLGTDVLVDDDALSHKAVSVTSKFGALNVL